MSDYRVGIGYDLHRLVADRALMLGGIAIPHDKGLLGHSDGDVLLHAVIDGLLGACGLPDIGELFPDTDPQYAGADSMELLKGVVAIVHEHGFAANNVDCVVHAEKPRLGPYKKSMAESIAATLNLPPDRVSVKAKTNEGVGAVGNAQAIAATVVVSVISKDQNRK